MSAGPHYSTWKVGDTVEMIEPHWWSVKSVPVDLHPGDRGEIVKIDKDIIYVMWDSWEDPRRPIDALHASAGQFYYRMKKVGGRSSPFHKVLNPGTRKLRI